MLDQEVYGFGTKMNDFLAEEENSTGHYKMKKIASDK
jgi:hypothetical protein